MHIYNAIKMQTCRMNPRPIPANFMIYKGSNKCHFSGGIYYLFKGWIKPANQQLTQYIWAHVTQRTQKKRNELKINCSCQVIDYWVNWKYLHISKFGNRHAVKWVRQITCYFVKNIRACYTFITLQLLNCT